MLLNTGKKFIKCLITKPTEINLMLKRPSGTGNKGKGLYKRKKKKKGSKK